MQDLDLSSSILLFWELLELAVPRTAGSSCIAAVASQQNRSIGTAKTSNSQNISIQAGQEQRRTTTGSQNLSIRLQSN